VKSRYKRTNKKGFVQQLARIERRQARIRRIRSKMQEKNITAEDIPRKPEAHHEIGTSENFKQHLGSFLEEHSSNPAALVSLSWLGLTCACADDLTELCVETESAPVGLCC
jgi:hypothetical protein